MISIVIPTYNEKDNILLLIKSVEQNLKVIKNIKYEIIIVDDNSIDGTSYAVNKIINRNIKLITRKNERGLATAIKTGIENSSGNYLMVMDADLSHPPEFLINLITTLKDQNLDVVIASRYIRGGRMNSNKYKYLLSKLMNYFLGIMLNLKIKDLTGGFFIINRKLLDKINMDKVFIGYGDYFFRLFYELKNIDYSYKEIPFEYVGRVSGESKTRTFKMGSDYIKTMLSLLTRK